MEIILYGVVWRRIGFDRLGLFDDKVSTRPVKRFFLCEDNCRILVQQERETTNLKVNRKCKW